MQNLKNMNKLIKDKDKLLLLTILLVIVIEIIFLYICYFIFKLELSVICAIISGLISGTSAICIYIISEYINSKKSKEYTDNIRIMLEEELKLTLFTLLGLCIKTTPLIDKNIHIKGNIVYTPIWDHNINYIQTNFNKNETKELIRFYIPLHIIRRSSKEVEDEKISYESKFKEDVLKSEKAIYMQGKKVLKEVFNDIDGIKELEDIENKSNIIMDELPLK